jgi:hypothetical protein
MMVGANSNPPEREKKMKISGDAPLDEVLENISVTSTLAAATIRALLEKGIVTKDELLDALTVATADETPRAAREVIERMADKTLNP